MKHYFFLLFPLIIVFGCSKKPSKNIKKLNNIFYNKAYEFLNNKKTDSAFLYFNKAKDIFLSNKNKFGTGKCLVNMAIISSDKGDFIGGQELSLQAIPYFDEKEQDQHIYISSNYNNLGIASFRLEDYENALKFYDLAIKFSKKPKDINLYLNNKANAYQESGKFEEALEIYEGILKEIDHASQDYAMALTNFSYTKWLQINNYNPIPNFLKALSIRKKESNFLGLNSSYASLADYYTIKRPDSAFHYALKMYQVAKIVNSADDQLQALQKLINLSPTKQIKQYFEIYRKLDDSVENARHAAKNQFALIRYDAEKHKVDFLKAQTENTQKQNSILKLYLAIGILISLLIFGYLYYKRRKKRLQQEKELEVKNTALKYSKKVHDRVANKIYHVMSVVENTDELNKDNLLDDLEVIYDISRDISYDNLDVNIENNFANKISEMIQSYASAKTKIITNGNNEQLWQIVNPHVRSEIYCVLQELMTNMKKHSKADEVQINFEKKDHQIFISYFDNGVGIRKETPHNNGLTNTGNRIKSINGTINFDTEVEKGLKIQIYFPIS